MNGKHSNGRPAGREHFPAYPRGFIAIRIVQLIVAVIILGLDAYTLSIINTSGNELNIFTALATMIIAIYGIVVHFHAGAWKGYNYWAVLGLDIFAVIFWLISFALIAAEVGPYASSGFEWTTCDGFYCTTWVNYMLFPCMATVAGLGGMEFVTFIVALAIHSVAMHKHRAAGLHCSPLSSSHHTNNGDIPMGGPVQHNGQPEKQQAGASYAAAPDQQQHQQPDYASAPIQQQQQQQQQQYVTQTPPPQAGQAPYQAPAVASPQPYHGQQQQQQQQPPQQVSPLGATGQQQGSAYAPPHAGSYEAHGQAVGQQQY